MGKLVAFCEAFYPGTLVRILAEKDLLTCIPDIRHRRNCYGEQYLCDDILAYMKTLTVSWESLSKTSIPDQTGTMCMAGLLTEHGWASSLSEDGMRNSLQEKPMRSIGNRFSTLRYGRWYTKSGICLGSFTAYITDAL